MDTIMSMFIGNFALLFIISIWILGIYALVLLIKALKIYIKKNS